MRQLLDKCNCNDELLQTSKLGSSMVSRLGKHGVGHFGSRCDFGFGAPSRPSDILATSPRINALHLFQNETLKVNIDSVYRQQAN